MKWKLLALAASLALTTTLTACGGSDTTETAPTGDAMEQEGGAMEEEGGAMKEEGGAMEEEGGAMEEEGSK